MRRNPWFRLMLDASALGLEASSVITARMLKLAGGGPAANEEMQRMITEKVEAGAQLQHLAATGGLGSTPETAAAKTIALYRRKVRANKRRLAKD